MTTDTLPDAPSARPAHLPQPHAATTHAGRPWTDPLTLVPALLIAALLGFAAFTKFAYPNPKQVSFDALTGALEIALALGVLVLQRSWGLWGLVIVFFGGMTGWSLFKSYHGEACGCFAALWEPPKFFTAGLNGVIILTSLGLMLRRGGSLPLATGVISLALAAGVGGWIFSDVMTPPKRSEVAQIHGGKSASQRLLESELLADVRAQEAGGPSWLIFAHDPDCHICEQIKPFVEFKMGELADSADPVLQIRSVSIPEAAQLAKIEAFAWETPTIFLVKDGVIVAQWSGKPLEAWNDQNLQQIHDQLAVGTIPPSPLQAGAAAGATPGVPTAK